MGNLIPSANCCAGGCPCLRSGDQQSVGFQGPSPLLQPLRQSFAYHFPSAKIVVITLIRMEKIPARGPGGTSNPYLKLKLSQHQTKFADVFAGNQEQRSSSKSETVDPEWRHEEKFTFRLNSAQIMDTSIICSINHVDAHNPTRENEYDHLGAVLIKLKDYDVLSSSGISLENESFPIKTANGTNHGRLIVNISVQDPLEHLKAMTHGVYEYYFLDSVISSDRSNWKPVSSETHAKHGRYSDLAGKKWGMDKDEMCPEIPQGYTAETWLTIATEANTTDGAEGWEFSSDFTRDLWFVDYSIGRTFKRRLWQRNLNQNKDYRAISPAGSYRNSMWGNSPSSKKGLSSASKDSHEDEATSNPISVVTEILAEGNSN